MPGSAAQEICVAVVHLAPDQCVAPVLVLPRRVSFTHVALVSISRFACGNAGLQRSFGIEECVLQVERIDNFRDRKLCESLMVQKLFDQKAESDETEIAVDQPRSWFVFEIEIRNRRERSFGIV